MTTATVPHSRALTAYLNRATWGLPDHRRQELWDELEEHVLTRADHLLLSGLSPTQALAQAIRELGPPARVTLGMAKVYSMPKLLLAAGTLALGLSAGLYALAGGGGSTPITLPVITNSPVKPSCVRGTKPTGNDITIVSEKDGVTCYTFNDTTSYTGVYLPGKDLAKAISTQGGNVRLSGTTLSVNLPGFNSGGGDLHARFTRDGEPYFDAASLILTIGTPLSITFTDYDAPQIKIGAVNLQLGQGETSVGRSFYNPLYSLVISALKGEDGRSTVVGGGYYIGNRGAARLHHVQTPFRSGEVVMLITKRAGENYMADTSKVAADHTVTLQGEANSVRFVSSIDQLGPYPSGGRINALLVRVTNIPLNNLKSGIFLPAQLTSDAR